jgi:hypothetical protein
MNQTEKMMWFFVKAVQVWKTFGPLVIRKRYVLTASPR